MFKKIFSILNYIFSIILILILIFDISDLKIYLSKFPIYFWFLAPILSLTSQLILSSRWYLLLNKLKIKLSYLQGLKIYLAGLYSLAYPARTGEFIRGIWMQNKYNIDPKKIYTVTFFERLQDLLSVILLFIFCIELSNSRLNLSIILAFLILLNLSIFYYEEIYKNLKNFMNFLKLQMIYNPIINYLKKFFLKYIYKKLNRPLFFWGSLTITSIAWIVESLIFFYFFQIINIPITLKEAIAIRSAGALGSVFSLLPGGLGTNEGASVGFSLFIGIPFSESIAATIFFRINSFLIPLFTGYVFYFLQRTFKNDSNS